jgi:pilus assembly protein Flp/PilA
VYQIGTRPHNLLAAIVGVGFLWMGLPMTKFFSDFAQDESGASAAEYALILAIVGTAIAVAAINLGGAIANSMGNATRLINNPSSAA